MIVAFVPDLMDRSKVAAAVPGVRFVASPSELVAAACPAGADARVILDVSRPGVIEAVRLLAACGATMVGFGRHTARDVLEQARVAGCQRVLARSAFFATIRQELGLES